MMQSRENRALFELIRGALAADYTPSAELFGAGLDWSKLFEQAKRQTIVAMVWEAIERLPSEAKPPRDVAMKWFAYVNRVAQTNKLINSRVKELSILFETNDLHPILMKGASLSILYPNPLRRGCGDIDIYFGADEIVAAEELLCKTYGDESCDEKRVDDSSMHSHFRVGGISVEVHRYMSWFSAERERKVFEAGIDEWFYSGAKQIEIDGAMVRAIPDKFNTQFIYIHTVRHFIEGGVGLRQLCDLCVLLNNTHITEADIFVNKSSWKLIERLLVRYLGLNPERALYNDASLDKRVDRVMEFVLREGNFGFGRNLSSKRPTGFWSSKAFNLIVYLERNIKLVGIFPRETVGEFFRRIPHSLLRALRATSQRT